jgi:tetratricopeptide (TPR) repeat protein
MVPNPWQKKGDKLREAGIHMQAVSYYTQSLDRDKSNVNAQLGLRKSGGEVMSKYQAKFFQEYNSSNHKLAVYTYLEMSKFEERMDKYHAEITIPKHINYDFQLAKKKYLEKEFEEANELMSQEQFEEAEVIFHEIQSIEPSYRGSDLTTLKEIAQLEPVYRNGNTLLDQGKNRYAYFEFKNVTSKNNKYKDAQEKLEESLELAQFPVAVLKFKNYSKNRDAAVKVEASTINALLKNKGPFLKVLDRTHMEKVLNEQYLAMNGWVEGSGAVKTGELLGSKAILSGKVLSVNVVDERPKLNRQKGYKRISNKVYNPQTKKTETKISYKKIFYNNFYGKTIVTVSFQYILVSSETGEVLLSGIVEKEMKSTVDYNTFNGGTKDLYPGVWRTKTVNSTYDKIYTNRNKVQSFQNKFSANRTLTPVSELSDDAYKIVGNSVSNKVYNFNPEK